MRSDEQKAHEILELALTHAHGDEADAVLFQTERNVSRFANSSLRQNVDEATGSLSVRVIVDGRIGVASSSSLTADGIRSAAQLARKLAETNERVDDFPGLYRGGEEVAELDCFDEATASADLSAKAESLRRAFDAGRDAGVRFAGTYTTAASSVATANTHGVRRFARFTNADAMLIALAEKTSGFATQVSRRINALDIGTLAREATDRALLHATVEAPLAPGKYDVIIEPAALAEIFEWMNMITFSARSFDDGSSFFAGKLGVALLDRAVTFADDALDQSFLPFPFDLEGRPKRRVALVENGTPRTPTADTWFAHRLGIEPTASAVDLASDDHGMAMHLTMAAGASSREKMIATSERAIWITRFHYINGLLEPKSALMTGMTRDGTFLVENGRVTRRLANLRWTQSMVEAFANVVALSAERRAVSTWWNPIGGTLAPTVKIRDWNITGVQGESAGG